MVEDDNEELEQPKLTESFKLNSARTFHAKNKSETLFDQIMQVQKDMNESIEIEN